jgi:predicted nucleotide-binding protein
MKVFLSWSGERSRALAEALRDWIPDVLQVVQPWLSSEDIPLGARWASEIARILEDADTGIICLTQENVHSQWLNFEAGALSKQLSAPLCVYALDLRPADISGPLSQFQCARADKESTFRLIRTLNSLSADFQISEERLERLFNLHWPLLDDRLKSISATPVSVKEGSDSQSLEGKIDEALELLRALYSASSSMPEPPRHLKTPVHEKSRSRPRVFIGSSTEGLDIAEAIQVGLDPVAECTIWNQGLFKPSITTIESIVDVAVDFDYAIIVLTPDDMVIKRGEEVLGPRDNIVFELGLFTGTLGRARTFMVLCRDDQVQLPTDLAGVTVAMYSRRSDGNLVAALGPVCTQIKRAMGVAKVI